MKIRKYFPLGKAYGEAFCNRVEESKWLISNLLNAQHSLLIAPRRFGKSSLAEKAIAMSKLPFVKINFHLCTTDREVVELIVLSVSQLISKTVGPIEKTINSIKKYVTNLHPKLTFGHDLISLELMPKQEVNHALVISESLLLIEKLLRDKNRQAVIFFDEFQELAKVKKNNNLEGAIRTAAQEMQNVSIIFSGSIRSLLLRMFEDESRPLYKLCRKLKLDRIAAVDYEKHINKIAVTTWHKKLDAEVFNEIMLLSNRHPYYVNYLCDVLWDGLKLPTIEQVKKAWTIVVEEEWSDALRELSMLSLAQRKILKYFATHVVDNILSQQTCNELSLPGSTVSSAVKQLVEKDYLEFDNKFKRYELINPLFVSVLTDNFLSY